MSDASNESWGRDEARRGKSMTNGLKVTGVALGRVGRWFFFGVILAVFPLLFAFFFRPTTESVEHFLGNGELVVLSAAIAGASIGELIGPREPPKWLRNLTIAAAVADLLAAILLLSMIEGKSPWLLDGESATWSERIAYFAVAVGAATAIMTADFGNANEVQAKASANLAVDGAPKQTSPRSQGAAETKGLDKRAPTDQGEPDAGVQGTRGSEAH